MKIGDIVDWTFDDFTVYRCRVIEVPVPVRRTSRAGVEVLAALPGRASTVSNGVLRCRGQSMIGQVRHLLYEDLRPVPAIDLLAELGKTGETALSVPRLEETC
jgi:hypothetical protein